MSCIKATFHFLSHKAWLKSEDLESDDLPLGWFVINWRWFGNFSKNERRKMYGKWFRIRSTYGVTYRCLRFATNGLRKTAEDAESKDQIVLDWEGWIRLSGYGDHEREVLELVIRRATFREVLFAAWKHPEPAYRLSFRISIIALLVGLFSLAVAIGSFPQCQ
jgi:hypothetical protein